MNGASGTRGGTGRSYCRTRASKGLEPTVRGRMPHSHHRLSPSSSIATTSQAWTASAARIRMVSPLAQGSRSSSRGSKTRPDDSSLGSGCDNNEAEGRRGRRTTRQTARMSSAAHCDAHRHGGRTCCSYRPHSAHSRTRMRMRTLTLIPRRRVVKGARSRYSQARARSTRTRTSCTSRCARDGRDVTSTRLAESAPPAGQAAADDLHMSGSDTLRNGCSAANMPGPDEYLVQPCSGQLRARHR